MPRENFKPSHSRNDFTGEVGAGSGSDVDGRFGIRGTTLLSGDLFGPEVPERHLAQAGERLQGVVGELEGLLFEAPGLGSGCRNEVHDAIGLVMDALQALGHAQRALKRSRTPGSAAAMLSVPMARA